MTKNKINKIEAKVMKEIKAGKIQIKSKFWYTLANTLLVMGASLSLLVAGFFLNLIIYQIQSRAEQNCYFVKTMVLIYTKNPPLIIIFSAILFIGLAIFLIKKFGFNYRKKNLFTAALIAFLVLILGVFISQTSFNQRHQGRWKWVYCQLNENSCERNNGKVNQRCLETQGQCLGKQKTGL